MCKTIKECLQYFVDYNGHFDDPSVDPMRSIVVKIDNDSFNMQMELFYNSVMLIVVSKGERGVCSLKYEPAAGFLSFVEKLSTNDCRFFSATESVEDLLNEDYFFQRSIVEQLNIEYHELVEIHELLGECSKKLLSIGGVVEQLYE